MHRGCEGEGHTVNVLREYPRGHCMGGAAGVGMGQMPPSIVAVRGTVVVVVWVIVLTMMSARFFRPHQGANTHTSFPEPGDRDTPSPTAGSRTGAATRLRREEQPIFRRPSHCARWSSRQSCRSRWIHCGGAGSRALRRGRRARGAEK